MGELLRETIGSVVVIGLSIDRRAIGRVGRLQVVGLLLHLRGVRVVHEVPRLGEAAIGLLICSPYFLLLTGGIGERLREGGGSGRKGTSLLRGKVAASLTSEVEVQVQPICLLLLLVVLIWIHCGRQLAGASGRG